jgi:Ca-activated chloride channel family protein
LEDVVSEAVDNGIKLYSIGLGSPSGSPIPVFDNAGNRVGFKKDRQGNTVISKLDEQTLQKIARLGNGNYYRGFQNDNELEKIYKDLSGLKESEFGTTKITEYEDRFYYFLIPAILILFIEFFITNRKSKFFMKFDQKIEES